MGCIRRIATTRPLGYLRWHRRSVGEATHYNARVRVQSSAPTRLDLAGGTLDIWPLYLFHNGAITLNANPGGATADNFLGVGLTNDAVVRTANGPSSIDRSRTT